MVSCLSWFRDFRHLTFNLDVIFCMKMSEMTSDVIDHPEDIYLPSQ